MCTRAKAFVVVFLPLADRGKEKEAKEANEGTVRGGVRSSHSCSRVLGRRSISDQDDARRRRCSALPAATSAAAADHPARPA